MRTRLHFWGVIAACIVAVAGLCWAIVAADNADMARFMAKCAAAGKSQGECELLAEIKSSADSARNVSAVNLGYQIGSGR
jgi:hypothetical protein